MAANSTVMVVSGFIVSVSMLRFDMAVLHLETATSFLSILWCDMIIFGTCMALAIYCRSPQLTTIHYGCRLLTLPPGASALSDFPRFWRIRFLYFQPPPGQ